jgi:hypothetical protein
VLSDSYPNQAWTDESFFELARLLQFVYIIERTVFWILVLYYIDFVWSVDEVQEKPQTIKVFLKLTIS